MDKNELMEEEWRFVEPSPWSDEAKQEMREYVKDCPRDSKGRFTKE